MSTNDEWNEHYMAKDKIPELLHYCNIDIKDLVEQYLPGMPDEIKYQLFPQCKPKRYHLIEDPKERSLTAAEYNCVVWLIKGKTAEEIGIISGVSKRTIELHILNIKSKFECSKLTQLSYTLIKYGL